MQPAAYIFDLDGLILDTESLCVEVATQVLQRHGKELTREAQRAALGKRPLDCWRDVAAVLGLSGGTAAAASCGDGGEGDGGGEGAGGSGGSTVTPEQLMAESEPLLAARWADVRPLPGARRLLEHLASCGVRVAVATSTSRATFDSKLSKKPWMRELFQAAVCGDEVASGKPAPDVFVAAAAALGVEPSACLCFEDAPSGVEGAVAAGMKVVVVPSLVGSKEDYSILSKQQQQDSLAAGGVVEVLPSLLAWDPTAWGLPAFRDLVPPGVIPVTPAFSIRGNVVKGFGRGSKELGIPTANVDADALRQSLAEAVTGIYCGWASIGASPRVYKMCMSIGWNPFYGNQHKTAEPWILHTFEQPFYGEEIRLIVCGYVRPEANFTSLEALAARIRHDGEVSEAALGEPQLQQYADDPFLRPAGHQQQRTLATLPLRETAAVAAEGAGSVDAADEVVAVAAAGG